MKLGVVLTGVGAHAACGAGVLAELDRRGVAPFAVCGMHQGAWPAALYVAGLDAQQRNAALLQAAQMGARMLAPRVSSRALLGGGQAALLSGRRMQSLLRAQAGERILALCPRQGVFLCRTARGGRRVIFSTQAYVQEAGAMLAMQASVSFAARAAMATPPFLAPMDWMGSALLPEEDAAFACRQLLLMGAHRVLVVCPVPSVRRRMDALELTAARTPPIVPESLPQHAALLRVPMPDDAGALSLSKIPACAQAGEQTAGAELDGIFGQMGMAFCRVLPFRRQLV